MQTPKRVNIKNQNSFCFVIYSSATLNNILTAKKMTFKKNGFFNLATNVNWLKDRQDAKRVSIEWCQVIRMKKPRRY